MIQRGSILQFTQMNAEPYTPISISARTTTPEKKYLNYADNGALYSL